MKKVVILFLSLVSIAVTASAQLGEKTTFGVRAAMGFGGFSSSQAFKLIGGTKESNWNIENCKKITYNVGAVIDIPVYHKWGLSLQTGLWFTERHNEFKGTNSSNASNKRNLDIKAMYLQLPVQLGYHYNLGVVNLQALAGPYLEYRVGDGNSKAESSKGNLNGVSAAFDSYDKELSYGLTLGLGAEYKKMYLGLKYDLGLINYYDGSNSQRKTKDELDLKGNMISVVLGWNF